MAEQRQAHHRRHPGSSLTERQREVLALVARGKTNGEIATELGITLDGVKWHLREVFARLNVDSREEAVAAWRSGRSPMARMRDWVGLGGLSLRAAPLFAAGAGTLMVAAVLVFVLARASDDPSPAQIEATQTAEAEALRPAPCQGDDTFLHAHRDFSSLDRDAMGGFSVIAETPCRIVGDLTVTVLDNAGKPIVMPGNPARLFLDIDSPDGLVVPGVRIVWRNRCAHDGEFVVRIAAMGNSYDAKPFPYGPQGAVPETCSNPMSLEVSGAAWDRHTYRSEPLTNAELTANPSFPDAIPEKLACGQPEWVCEAVANLEYWSVSGEWAGSPGSFYYEQFYCGMAAEVPKSFQHAHPPYIVPMKHEWCTGKTPGQVGRGPERVFIDTGAGGVETDDNGPSLPLNYERPSRVASTTCIAGYADCKMFIVAVEIAGPRPVEYFIYRGEPTNVDKAQLLAWGWSDDRTMLTGGVAETPLGPATFVPLP